MSVEKIVDMVKFDPPRTKTKLVCTSQLQTFFWREIRCPFIDIDQ